jgi:hypothetical protein
MTTFLFRDRRLCFDSRFNDSLTNLWDMPAETTVRQVGKNAKMCKGSDEPIVEPAASRSLLVLLATLAPLDENFPAIEDLAPGPSSA